MADLDLVDQRDAGGDERQRRQQPQPRQLAVARAWSRRLEVMAMTTGRVPMIIVGNGPPARWMAPARNR